MNWLGTTKPLISFAESKLPFFESFINKYKWELTETIPKLNNNKIKELYFNKNLSNPK